jgi:hypothetical protein
MGWLNEMFCSKTAAISINDQRYLFRLSKPRSHIAALGMEGFDNLGFAFLISGD